jgi:hypothetical protein
MNIKINISFVLAIMFTLSVTGQDDSDTPEVDLGQKTQNPLADLIVIPFQNNIMFNGSQNHETGYLMNIMPVYPIAGKKVSLINRAVITWGYIPGIYQGGDIIPGGWPEDGHSDGVWGLGDFNLTSYVTPKPKGAFSWGIGPSVTMPTATDNRLGSGKWSLGPSAVIVWQPKQWTIDAIIRQLWSVGGDNDRLDVNQFYVQPLVAYNLNNRWAVATMPVITANWNYDDDNKWMVPIGGGFNKLFKLNKTPLLLMVHYYYNAIKPELAASSELRIQLSFILSK